jgi:hypothetical protein
VQGGATAQYVGLSPSTGISTASNLPILAGGTITANNSAQSGQGFLLLGNGSIGNGNELILAQAPPGTCVNNPYAIRYLEPNGADYVCPGGSTSAPKLAVVAAITGSFGLAQSTGVAGLAADSFFTPIAHGGLWIAGSNFSSQTSFSGNYMGNNGGGAADYNIAFNDGSPATPYTSAYFGGWVGITSHFVDGSTDFYTGNASGTGAMGNGVTATTQSSSDSSTKLATDAFVHNVTNGALTPSSLTITDTAANTDLTLGLTSYTLGITGSPIQTWCGSYESVSTPTYAQDCWTLSDLVATGVNGISQLTFKHSGSTAYGVSFPFANAVSSANNYSQIFIDSTAGATVTGGTASTGIGFRSHVNALQNWYIGTGGNAADWFRIDNLTQNVDGLDITSGVPQVNVISIGLCASTATCTADTGISRASTGLVDVGTGAAGSAAGSLNASSIELGAPTGALEGAGTINVATGYYVNGTNISAIYAPLASPTFTGTVTLPALATTTNCSNAASPAVCGSAAAGSVLIPTGTTSETLTVNTTAVTANSQIFFYPDDSLGTKLGVTCNSTLATLVGGSAITARTPGTSFTITFNGTILTNGVCGSYSIVN